MGDERKEGERVDRIGWERGREEGNGEEGRGEEARERGGKGWEGKVRGREEGKEKRGRGGRQFYVSQIKEITRTQ